jgi:glycosyltransferase involved in cell wall biosynthesis
VIDFKISVITATRDRADILENHALSSLLSQTDPDFEWVLVNDGADPLTCQLVETLSSRFQITYLETMYPADGFRLAHARNKGLQAATGDIVCYLDDDNSFEPNYTREIRAFFRSNPHLAFVMAQQSRHRDVYRDGCLVRQGKTFVSPVKEASTQDLVLHRQLFDSNGFAHLRRDAPEWNPAYRIFIDYEYFLQCLNAWGDTSFGILQSVLVNYVQSSEGIIGKSTYRDWAEEIDRLCVNGTDYPSIDVEVMNSLMALSENWKARTDCHQTLPAFR